VFAYHQFKSFDEVVQYWKLTFKQRKIIFFYINKQEIKHQIGDIAKIMFWITHRFKLQSKPSDKDFVMHSAFVSITGKVGI